MIQLEKVAVVVEKKSNRSFFDFFKSWENTGLFTVATAVPTVFMVMEKNDKEPKIKDYTKCNIIYLDDDVTSSFFSNVHYIKSGKNSLTSFAYCAVAKLGYKCIITLSTCCIPPTAGHGIIYETSRDFVEEHLKYLEKRTRWFSPYNESNARGIPYRNLGGIENNIVNCGQTIGSGDLNLAENLSGKDHYQKPEFDNRVIPPGTYFPINRNNLAFDSSAVVLFYSLLMDGPHPFSNYGDIWSGIIAKRICDSVGKTISCGMPLLYKTSEPFQFEEVKKEAPAIEVNEYFWEYVSFAPATGSGDLKASYYLMGEHIEKFDYFKEYKKYFYKLGQSMRIWSEICQKEGI